MIEKRDLRTSTQHSPVLDKLSTKKHISIFSILLMLYRKQLLTAFYNYKISKIKQLYFIGVNVDLRLLLAICITFIFNLITIFN